MHTRKQWKTDYLIQIEYQLHWMVKWKQDMRGSNHSYLFSRLSPSLEAPYEKLVPSFSLDRGPTWGRNPKSKSVKWTTLRGQFVVQKLFNAPIIPYPSPEPKGWGFQLSGALILFFIRRNHNVGIYSFVYRVKYVVCSLSKVVLDLIQFFPSTVWRSFPSLAAKKICEEFDNNVCALNKLD